MNWTNQILALGISASLLPMPLAFAADHLDGAAVKTDASTDINDLYSWVSTDGTKVYLAMTVFPAASTASKFSNAAYYVFHTTSRSDFLNQNLTPTDVICSFDTDQKISCWIGTSGAFVYGDANNVAGITSTDGKVKVYAGLRKDHFFFNLDGFKDFAAYVKTHPPTSVDTTTGYATFNMTDRTAMSTRLNHTSNGTANPVDFFGGLDTLAIVLEIDKTLLNKGGAIMSVWAATVKKN